MQTAESIIELSKNYHQLAQTLVFHANNVQPGETVLIHLVGDVDPLFREILSEVVLTEAHACPIFHFEDNALMKQFIELGDEQIFTARAQIDMKVMAMADSFIGIRSILNQNDGVPGDKRNLFMTHYYRPVHLKNEQNTHRIAGNWAITYLPTHAQAIVAGLPLAQFQHDFFAMCNVNYAKMKEHSKALVERMTQDVEVHVQGPGTNLKFMLTSSIQARACSGEHNIPDGETFTAPVLNSVNGVLTSNTETNHNGRRFKNVRLEFKDGVVVEASAESGEDDLHHILDTDEGSKRIGEFALGYNFAGRQTYGNTLMDEKLGGNFHIALGNAYDDAFNGNESAVHCDIVTLQTRNHGGGTIDFNGTLIRKDGLFIPTDLEPLNRLG